MTRAARKQLWLDCATTLLDGVPYTHPDAEQIVNRCQALPVELRGPVMVRALAKRFGAYVGLTREQFEVCVYAPITDISRPARRVRAA